MKKLGVIIFLLLVLALCLGGFNFGIRDGLKINIAAALCAIENRTSNNITPNGLAVYDIKIEEKKWNKLVSNLPLSGKKKKSATFIYDGKEYKVKIRIRGNLKLHWGGEKKSLRVYFKNESPFGSIKQMNFINPKTYQLTNDHVAVWIGKMIGTSTLYNEMVFLKVNGKNYGVMEMVEQPTESYSINAGKSDKGVILYKGDYLTDKSGKSKSVLLWKDVDNWRLKGKRPDDKARIKLSSLINMLNNDSIPLKKRFQAIEEHVLVDDYLKYYAALTAVNTMHIDQAHNQIIVFNEDQEKYYPVLWDPTFMWAQDPNHYYNFYDPLSYYMLQNPIWRENRDRYIYSFLTEYYDSGDFITFHKQLEDMLWESVKQDHKKCNPVGSKLDYVYRFSNSIFLHSNIKIRKIADDYYQSLKQDMSNFHIERIETKDSLIQIDYATNSPLILKIECTEEVILSDIKVKNKTTQVLSVTGEFVKIKIYGQIEHEDGNTGSKYKQFSGFIQMSTKEKIYVGRKIKRIEIINAITQD